MKVKVAQSRPTLCDSMGYTVHGILQARILEWVAFPFSRGSSQPRVSNPGLLHCRRILYQPSHQGSPRILEWVAYSFSRGSSQPRNWTGVSCIAGRFSTSWATREAIEYLNSGLFDPTVHLLTPSPNHLFKLLALKGSALSLCVKETRKQQPLSINWLIGWLFKDL